MHLNKLIGAILLVIGTTIGSGMIALPLILSPIGLGLSIVLMVITWVVSYITALINLELNLQAGGGLSLGHLAKHYNCPNIAHLGTISLKVLSYALMVVFIYGGSEIVTNFLTVILGLSIPFNLVATTFSTLIALLLIFSVTWVDYVNRFLFTGLFIILSVLTIRISDGSTNFLELIPPQVVIDYSWLQVMPVLFTSFGFHVIFHTLTKYCQNNTKLLKRAFFWGSFLPVIIYITWTSLIVLAVHNHTPETYLKMINGNVDIGKLIETLSIVAKWPLAQVMAWNVTLLAIITSAIGVGLGLVDTWKDFSFMQSKTKSMRKAIATILSVGIPLIITLTVPNAFINLLGFAGMTLVIIAILIPLYLLKKSKLEVKYYPVLKSPLVRFTVLLFGIVVIISELARIISS